MFYKRLNDLCLKAGLKITAFAKDYLHVSNATPTAWKNGSSPKVSVVAEAAKFFNVSSDYLIGLTDDPRPVSMVTDTFASIDDVQLLKALHSAPDAKRDLAYKMAFAALDVRYDERETGEHSHYYSDGGKNARKAGFDSVLPSSPKLRQLGVRKGASALAFRGVEGKAAAGLPRTAVREGDVHILVPVKYTGEQYFIVQAEGDSMIGVVNDGDYCVFNKRGHFDDGRICLVQADGATDEPDAMIKRVYRRGDRVELRSENRKYPPRFYPVEEVVLMGELVAVLSPDSCQLPER